MFEADLPNAFRTFPKITCFLILFLLANLLRTFLPQIIITGNLFRGSSYVPVLVGIVDHFLLLVLWSLVPHFNITNLCVLHIPLLVSPKVIAPLNRFPASPTLFLIPILILLQTTTDTLLVHYFLFAICFLNHAPPSALALLIRCLVFCTFGLTLNMVHSIFFFVIWTASLYMLYPPFSLLITIGDPMHEH